MPKHEHLNVLKKGIGEWNDWRKANPSVAPDLTEVDLSRQILKEADFSRTNLAGATLRRAELIRANLNEAILSDSDLEWADLRWIDAIGADFRKANLLKADLYKAELRGALFSRANLAESNLEDANCCNADFASARFVQTRLLNTSIREARGLDEVDHLGPSIVDFDTLVKSGGSLSRRFLRGCGLTEPAIKAAFAGIAHDLTAQLAAVGEFHSCFISYSHADGDFASLLHDRLQEQGVRCWRDEHELLPGDDLYDSIERGIRQQDKVLLCASQSSLKSWWVDGEINRAFRKEAEVMKVGGEKVITLVPLNLDGFLFSQEYRSGKKAEILSRVAANFVGWMEDHAVFDRELERVLLALRRKEGESGESST